MGEETSNVVNLDLNLGPAPEVGSLSLQSEPLNLENFIHEPIQGFNEAFRIRALQHWRLQRLHMPQETHTLSVELDQLIGSSGDVGTLLPGEGSTAADERTRELSKTCEDNGGFLENNVSMRKGDVEEGNGNCGSFFDCNICLELATDPVVSSCGHLFCWSCLYRLLHVHSDLKECPVCKEEITVKNVTPIYGRGSNSRKAPIDLSFQIPIRPRARRVESFRQAIYRNPFSFPLEEIIRRIGSRFNLTRDFNLFQNSNGAPEMVERTSSFPNTIMTLGGVQSDQNPNVPLDDIVDLTHSGTTSPEVTPARRLRSLLLRRSHSLSQRPSAQTSIPSSSNPSERLLEAFLRSHPIGMNQEQPQPLDDRDSFSSIAAVINSESQVDTAVEIDSMGTFSNSSSRRRSDSSRVYDVDSGDSRAPRRRRLN
ncbi:uncharacterized protein LOC126660704 [Mercurialis annua]|uniref:uncharacterized protein LOC126660704 n=1 Tax=Mercurialis annua TaxID=3986 RepID=UPI00215E7438|nr:uncharacterized protein LOC126660704 [Mercurialis annua]XP_050210294.1 uncharacterized protein LOC126660704 [Mercurialis annua]XP_050210295.1 uncharacterized protein LOC126660704 [Mercurialis annua]XP_050210296.1 uncharacterized protein LOC126660704 [Mercurialis annua]XP_050210298.1 uncharacterized protein LOC126660704 [Mercurialis annua]XP_050210299.1 uncharacterized protein LOC126660704 [Mercurialis annua]XP_050210300.1 uncharacterized protein LOC126660704 [Mercurialis annua]XP_05021030